MTADAPPTRVRFAVLFALSLGAILAYLLRTCVATAGTTIQRDLGIGDVAMGGVLGAFFVGYFWFQIPAGWLGSRIGARASLVGMGLLWALAMLMSAMARGEGVLSASRFLQGAAQAGLFAVTIMALAEWFPPSRRGFASAVITGCMSVGAVIASGLTGRLIGPFGWRPTFLGFSAVVLAWAAWVAVWFRNRPGEHKGVNGSEANLIRGGVKARQRGAQKTPVLPVFRDLARSRGMWALNSQAFFRSFGYAFFITWFPAYLEKAHGMKVVAAGDFTMFPLIGVIAGSFVGGSIIDSIYARTGNRRLSRCGVAGASLVFCGLATLAAAWATGPTAAVFVISVGSFFSGIAGPAAWAALIDITGRQAAIGFSVMNMVGNLGAVACPYALGYLFAHISRTDGDWNVVLYLFAAVYLVGALSWLVMDPEAPALTSEF